MSGEVSIFGIAGTEKALAMGAPAVVAVLLGIVPGVAGGSLRDVLRGEIPWVFKPEVNLYAPAVFVGALVYILLQQNLPASPSHRYVGMAVVLCLRLAAMRWKLRPSVSISVAPMAAVLAIWSDSTPASSSPMPKAFSE